MALSEISSNWIPFPRHVLDRRGLELNKINILDLPPDLIGSDKQTGFIPAIETIMHGYFLSDTVFKHSDLTRLNVPIFRIPQIEMYHQFSVEDHLLIAAYSAFHFSTTLAGLLDDKNYAALVSCLSNQQIQLYLGMGGYLHDIEKLLSPFQHPFNPVVPESWSASRTGGTKPQQAWSTTNQKDLALQNFLINSTLTSTQQRLVITDHLAKLSDSSEGLEGLIPRLLPEIDPEKLKSILEIYNFVDKAIIDIWTKEYGAWEGAVPDREIVDTAVRELCEIFKNMDTYTVFSGLVLVLADNFAQGLPPSRLDLFAFHQTINVYIVNQVIKSLL